MIEGRGDLCPELIRAISACGDPAFVVGEDWVVLHWNKAAEAAFERPAAEVEGHPCYDVIAGIDDDGRQLCRLHCEKWALARRGAHIRNFDIRALRDHELWANVAILPISDASGRTVALAHVLRNVSRTKRLESFIREIATTADDVLTSRAGNGHVPARVHLTMRELEVLNLLAHGAGTDMIADRLGVSRHTAHNHIAVILNKLGVHSRAEAVAYAFAHRLA